MGGRCKIGHFTEAVGIGREHDGHHRRNVVDEWLRHVLAEINGGKPLVNQQFASPYNVGTPIVLFVGL